MLTREEKNLERKGLSTESVVARKNSALQDRNELLTQLEELEAGVERLTARAGLRTKIGDLERYIDQLAQERETLEKHRLDTSAVIRRQEAARIEIEVIGKKLMEQEEDPQKKKKSRRSSLLKTKIQETEEEIRSLEKEVSYLNKMGLKNSNQSRLLDEARKRLSDYLEELGEAKSGVFRTHSKPRLRQMLQDVDTRIDAVMKEKLTLSRYHLDTSNFDSVERRLLKQRAELLQQLEQPDPSPEDTPSESRSSSSNTVHGVDVLEDTIPLHVPTRQDKWPGVSGGGGPQRFSRSPLAAGAQGGGGMPFSGMRLASPAPLTLYDSMREAMQSLQFDDVDASVQHAVVLTRGLLTDTSDLVSYLLVELLPLVQGIMPEPSGNVLVLFKDAPSCACFLSLRAITWHDRFLRVIPHAPRPLPASGQSQPPPSCTWEIPSVPFDVDVATIRMACEAHGDVEDARRDVFEGTTAWNGSFLVSFRTHTPAPPHLSVLGAKYPVLVLGGGEPSETPKKPRRTASRRIPAAADSSSATSSTKTATSGVAAGSADAKSKAANGRMRAASADGSGEGEKGQQKPARARKSRSRRGVELHAPQSE